MVGQDKHCYRSPHDRILINTQGIKDIKELNRIEKESSKLTIIRLLANSVTGPFNLKHLQATHKAIFGEIYPWAGETRTIDRMTKAERLLNGGTVSYSPLMFLCDFTEKSLQSMREIEFNAKDERIAAELAEKITEVWIAHPFREGNTRTISIFLTAFAKERGFELDQIELNRTADETTFRDRFVLAFSNNYQPLIERITCARNRAIERNNVRD